MSETTIKKRAFKRENLMRYISLVSIIVLAFAFEAMQPNFLGRMNVAGMLRDNAALLVMAVGMTSILIFGSIDLSMGAMCSVANVLYVRIVVLFSNHYEAAGVEEPNALGAMIVATLACVLVGLISGFLLGVIHVKLKVPSFIASLGFMSVWTSAAYLISNRAESIPRKMSTASDWYRIAFFGDWIPLPLIIALVIAVVFYILQSRTVFGRTIFSIGGNERASRIAGMGVDRTKIIIFSLAGMCAALGGVFLASKIKSSDPTLGDPYTDDRRLVRAGRHVALGRQGLLPGHDSGRADRHGHQKRPDVHRRGRLLAGRGVRPVRAGDDRVVHRPLQVHARHRGQVSRRGV